METISDQHLAKLYPTAAIRAARVTRLGEKYLGPIWSTAETFRVLGKDNIGWFMGGFRDMDRIVDRVRELNKFPTGGRWVVAPATRELAAEMMERWQMEEGESKDIPAEIETYWHAGNVTVCLIESLRAFSSEVKKRDLPIAGIIIVDPHCIVHRSRGFHREDFYVRHDRPQLVVDFRNSLAIGNWSPPLIVVSLRRAGAVSTSAIQRAYYLEAFQFLEGPVTICNPRVTLAKDVCPVRFCSSEHIATSA